VRMQGVGVEAGGGGYDVQRRGVWCVACMQGVGVKGEGCVLCAFRVLRNVVGRI
jgi:hypothetical protein